MQRFMAELSTPIEKTEFEKSWHTDPSLNEKQPRVELTFQGCRVSAVIDSDLAERWAPAIFYRDFSAAIRRIDRACNVRWL
jgi:hypothetical protein